LTDSHALGRFLLERGETTRAVPLLLQAVEEGDFRAEILLSQFWKRGEEWQNALDLWDRILLKRQSLFASVEKAKYLEHRVRNISGALEITETLLKNLPLDQEQRRELLHRRARLVRKLERNIAEDGSGTVE